MLNGITYNAAKKHAFKSSSFGAICTGVHHSTHNSASSDLHPAQLTPNLKLFLFKIW